MSGIHKTIIAPVAEEETYAFPASFAQQRLWIVDQLARDSAAYNMPFAYNLRGPLSVPALLQALWMMVALPCATQAAVLEGTPDNYRQLLGQLGPGDELHLAAGEYLRGLPVHNLAGRPQGPIVITGPATGEPAVFIARPAQNTVSIIDSAHVEIRNLALDGRGIAVDAVKCEGHATFAHHITLQNLRIEGHGATQQTVGISTKCPAWGWVIRDNVIRAPAPGCISGIQTAAIPSWVG